MDLMNEDPKIIKAALYYAAGLISTLPQWEDQNPNEVVNWLVAMAKDDFEIEEKP